MTMKLTGGVVADWQAVSTEQQQRGERERESSEVGYVKRTIYILAKICNPKIKLCCFILFFYFLNSPIKLKRFVSLSHILGNRNHRFIRLVWYMCLKTENCYLKIFIEVRVSEKVH